MYAFIIGRDTANYNICNLFYKRKKQRLNSTVFLETYIIIFSACMRLLQQAVPFLCKALFCTLQF